MGASSLVAGSQQIKFKIGFLKRQYVHIRVLLKTDALVWAWRGASQHFLRFAITVFLSKKENIRHMGLHLFS